MPRAPPWKLKQLEYLERCSNRMLSTSSLKTYRYSLDSCHQFARDNEWPLQPAKVQPSNVRALRDSMVKQGIAPATQRLRLSILLDFLQFCGNNATKETKFKIKVSRSHVQWLSEEQVSELIATTITPQERAAFVLMAYTGMRLAEVCGLLSRDISPDQIRIRGKGGKERRLPLDLNFWEAIRPYAEWYETVSSDHFLVYHKNGQYSPYTTCGLYWVVRRHAERVGLEMSPHDLRRSFGRHLYKRGCPLAELQRIMGHSSLEMTIRYLGIDDEDVSHGLTFRPDYIGGTK